MTDSHVAATAGRQLRAAVDRLAVAVQRTVARYGMYFSVAGLLVIVAIVVYQVFGRYVLNSSPTWAENLALVLILYVTLIGAAVGVRDAGHIGMDSLLVLLPERSARQDRARDPRAGGAASASPWSTTAGSSAPRSRTTRSPTSSLSEVDPLRAARHSPAC